MKKILLLLLIIIFQSTSIISQENIHKQLNITKIPSVEIYDIEGNPVNTSTISNNEKPIIIDFWTTWCIPCVRELNTLNKYYKDWKIKTGVKIYIISLDKTDNIPKIKKLIKDNNWEFILLHDPNQKFKKAMNVREIPCTFIIDSERNIYSKHIGFYPGNENVIYNEITQICKKNNSTKSTP